MSFSSSDAKIERKKKIAGKFKLHQNHDLDNHNFQLDYRVTKQK